MRPAVVVLVVLLAACRREPATGAGSAGGPPTSEAPASPDVRPSGVSDEELVAFTRWQRDHMDLFRRHWEELQAVGSDDPSEVLRDPKGHEARVAEVSARQATLMQALLDRVPLKGEKAELLTEALGGLFHFDTAENHFDLVIAHDEVRLEAARRRFGKEVVDDIVARERLILAALEQP